MPWSWFGSSGSVIACESRKPRPRAVWDGAAWERQSLGKAEFGKGRISMISHSSGRKFNPSVPRGGLARGQALLALCASRYSASCKGKTCLLFFKVNVLKSRLGGAGSWSSASRSALTQPQDVVFLPSMRFGLCCSFSHGKGAGAAQ